MLPQTARVVVALGRDEATGRGLVTVIAAWASAGGETLTGRTVAVQGFGNVGGHAATHACRGVEIQLVRRCGLFAKHVQRLRGKCKRHTQPTDAGIRVTLVMPGFIRTNVSLNALTADGSAQGSMDEAQEAGIPPEECAERLVKAVQRGRDQVIIAGREGAGVYLKRWSPALYRRLIRKMKVT